MKKKKIAYFFIKFPSYPFTFIYHEIMGLIENGFDVEIFALHRGDRRELHKDFQSLWDKITILESAGRLSQLYCYYCFLFLYPLRMRYLKKRFTPHAENKSNFFKDTYLLPAFKAAWHLRKRKDIAYMHSHFSDRPSTLLYIMSQLLNIPRGFTTHADAFVEKKFKLLKEQVEDCHTVFTETHQAKTQILSLFDEPAKIPVSEKIIYKPTGINIEKFIDDGVSREKLNLVSLSRFDPKKGLMYLVRACHLLIQRGHNVQCTVIGDGRSEAGKKIKNEILEYIANHNLEKHFLLTGFLPQEEHIKYLKKSSIFLAPYIVTDHGERDGVPTSMIEAMAMGLVPVTTDAGAITELVDHNINGLIVPQKDYSALADAIESLITDGNLFEKLRNNAPKKIKSSRDVLITEQVFVNKIKDIINSSDA